VAASSRDAPSSTAAIARRRRCRAVRCRDRVRHLAVRECGGNAATTGPNWFIAEWRRGPGANAAPFVNTLTITSIRLCRLTLGLKLITSETLVGLPGREVEGKQWIRSETSLCHPAQHPRHHPGGGKQNLPLRGCGRSLTSLSEERAERRLLN